MRMNYNTDTSGAVEWGVSVFAVPGPGSVTGAKADKISEFLVITNKIHFVVTRSNLGFRCK